MANLKRIELSNELMLSFLKGMNIPDDSVITYCERDRIGIVIYIHSKEFEETREGCIPAMYAINEGCGDVRFEMKNK